MIVLRVTYCWTVQTFFFFFNDTPTTEIYTLSLHDALPICARHAEHVVATVDDQVRALHVIEGTLQRERPGAFGDRKSTRLNSSHTVISYAVFCLKKKTVAAY